MSAADAPIIDGGVDVVRRQIIGFLQARLPDALEAHRIHWQLEEPDLPLPVRWNEYEDEAVADVAPSIALSVGRGRGFTRRDYGPGMEQQYRVRYDVSVFAWLKAGAELPLADGGEQQPNPAQRMRDRYASVLEAVLLDTPSLGAPGLFSLDEGTMVVSYSAASRLRGDRYLTGVSVAFDLHHAETLRRLPLGSVADTVVEATVLVDNPD